MNRREFITRGGAAAAGFAAIGAGAVPNAPAAPEPVPTAPVVTSGPVIPPPSGKSTYLTRMSSVRALMREVGTEALVEPPGTNMRYLTGLDLGRSERLIAFVLPLEGEPVILGPMFERDRLAASPAAVAEVITWEEDDDPFEALQKILKKTGATNKKIAIGGTTWYDEFAQVNMRLPKMSFVSSTVIVGYLRERKSPEEIANMQAAIEITERSIGAALKEAREGIREDELEGLVMARILEMGARGEGLVQFGPRSAVPHNPTGDRRLVVGDIILVDFGAQVNGYWSDISRPAVLGTATGRMKLIHSTIRQAQDAALELAKPETPCSRLDQISRAALGGRGFSKFIVHRLGHGVGLDGHEPPWLTSGSIAKLSIGNVATLEPGVYTPSEYGIRVEDMMEVTAEGGRMLSHPPDKLLEI